MTVDETALTILPITLQQSSDYTYEEKLIMAKDLGYAPTFAERMLHRQLERSGPAFARRIEGVERLLDHVKERKIEYIGTALTASALITAYLRMR
jgi:hypothetical protein